MKIIDPYKVSVHDLPMVVLSDNLQSFISWRIKVHDKGAYSHGMWLVEPGVLISQGSMLKKVEAKEYMYPYNRLKFWKPELTSGQRIILRDAIYEQLEKHWVFRIYDSIGILGQLIGLPRLNVPFLHYCTENVVAPLKSVGMDYGRHPSPFSINKLFNADPRWKVAGYYLKD